MPTATFRAKCSWVENGEWSKGYFFNLEKRNCNKKPSLNLDCKMTQPKTMKTGFQIKLKLTIKIFIPLKETFAVNYNLSVIQKISNRDNLEGSL